LRSTQRNQVLGSITTKSYEAEVFLTNEGAYEIHLKPIDTTTTDYLLSFREHEKDDELESIAKTKLPPDKNGVRIYIWNETHPQTTKDTPTY
jgi:hypothetical protein